MNFLKRTILPTAFLLLTISCKQNNPVVTSVDGPEAVQFKATPFHLSEVQLLDSPFKTAQESEKQYLLDLEPDRLLHRFHKFAGLEPKAEIYGGWESRGISGHSLGHYLSACALMYATTGDQELKKRVNYTIAELARCQTARKTGYVGAIPGEDSVFTEVANGNIKTAGFDLNGLWVPWYTHHKMMQGLLDAYLYTGSDEALKVDTLFANWIDTKFANLTEEQFQEMLRCEHGGMNEVLADLYAVTGNPKYLDLSRSFNHKAVLDPLAAQEDKLEGLHANTQIPKIIGSARQYELTANAKDSTIASYFWHRVINHHSYVIGGNSEYEHFGAPDKLSHRLSAATAEGCNTYNMLKLTKHLFSWQPQSAYIDYYERALYNHILAAVNLKDGMVCYFMPLDAGTKKEYGTPYESFWCCTGTGMENPAKYGENIYFKDTGNGLLVNLFIPSRLNWKEQNTKVEMTTKFPLEETVKLRITEGSTEKSISVRKPKWLAGPITFKVNDEVVAAEDNGLGYATISRKWEKGDVLEFNLPMDLYTEAMPDDENMIALLKGPLVLAGDVSEAQVPEGESVLVTEAGPEDFVEPVSSMKFKFTEGAGPMAGVELLPFYQMNGQPHIVYWNRFTPARWEDKKAEYAVQLKAQQRLEAATIDILRVGEMQPERDHNVIGENTFSGEAFSKKYRHAENGGWFSAEMKVGPGNTELQVTYWGGETGPREFDILAEGQVIASESLHRDQPEEFFVKSYPIPSNLIKDKEVVTIRFRAKPGNFAGGVYGVRTVLTDKL